MNIVVDTSIIIAVVTNEECKPQIVSLTRNADLLAPSSLTWEIGNAFSAMFKRQRITLEQSRTALDAFRKIPIRLVDVDLEKTLKVAKELDIYAYDAYFIVCAQKHQCQLISLDSDLLDAAERAKVESIEVIS